MKGLSLWQPWASLVALGEKTIETRSWSTSYRGPLAIHAAKTTKGFDTLPGDCEGTTEAGWRYGYIGDYQVGYCYRSSDEGTRGDTFLVRLDGETLELVPPLGAIIATCELVDVVPMVDVMSGAGPDDHDASQHAVYLIHDEPIELVDRWADMDDVTRTRIIEDQRPYGDFRPGRFAWLLEDVRPLEKPIPARGRQGLWNVDGELLKALTPP